MRTETEIKQRLKEIEERHTDDEGEINYDEGWDEGEYAEMLTLGWVLGDEGY